jgi:hypothetical protein
MPWELTGNADATATSFLGSTNAQPLIVRTGPTPSATPPERLRITTEGRIGIGTAAPQARLSVAGAGAIINNVSIGTDGAGVNYPNEAETIGLASPGTNGILRLQSPNGLTFHTGAPGAAVTDNLRMTIAAGGEVGVGTAPGAAYKLDVAGVVNAADYHRNGSPLVGSQWTDAAGGGISYTAGNVGVGTAPGATYKVDVAGVVNATDYHKNGAPLSTSQWTNVSGGINYAGGNVGIGATGLSRKLHVQGSEIHSGGGGGGYSFGNRETATFVEAPSGGERWVWFASGGKARLWSGGDKLSVGIDGTITNVIVGPGANGRLKIRHIDGKHWLNDNDDALHLNWGTGKPVLLGFGNGTQAALHVSGDIRAGNSDIYFTKTDHNHTAIGNTAGYAAIENAANYGALMILGRAGTAVGRYVRLWDYLQVNGGMDVTGNVEFLSTSNPIRVSSGWTAFPDPVTNKAEISNDTGTYKTLMIVGNRSAGLGRRVSVWDRLEVNGTLLVTGGAFKPGGGWWSASSDIRLKKSVRPLKGALEKLSRLRGVSFEWKEPEKQGNLRGPQMGLIAQEVEKVLPEWVGADPGGYKSLTVRGFEALVVEAFKELKAQAETLRAKKEELEGRVKVLESNALVRPTVG